jgi:hypothetical protein
MKNGSIQGEYTEKFIMSPNKLISNVIEILFQLFLSRKMVYL